MSYTPPVGNAAHFSWVGVPTYTPPVGNAANFAWVVGYTASGSCSTQLGIASTPSPAHGVLVSSYGIPSLAMTVQGVCSTQFGTPETLGYYQAAAYGLTTAFGIPQREMIVNGFAATRVGIASTPFPASGFLVPQFGTPHGWQWWQQNSLPPATVIPGAFSPTHSTGIATGAQVGRYGSHTGMTINTQPADWITGARGGVVTLYGTHATPQNSRSIAYGALLVQYGLHGSVSPMLGIVARYGRPKSRTSHTASSLIDTAIGVPATSISGFATGALAFVSGVHGGVTAHPASSVNSTQYGAHNTYRPDVYPANSLGPIARIPVPKGWQRFNYGASGFCSVGVGTPQCRLAHRVRAIPPITRFGTHLLVRHQQC